MDASARSRFFLGSRESDLPSMSSHADGVSSFCSSTAFSNEVMPFPREDVLCLVNRRPRQADDHSAAGSSTRLGVVELRLLAPLQRVVGEGSDVVVPRGCLAQGAVSPLSESSHGSALRPHRLLFAFTRFSRGSTVGPQRPSSAFSGLLAARTRLVAFVLLLTLSDRRSKGQFFLVRGRARLRDGELGARHCQWRADVERPFCGWSPGI